MEDRTATGVRLLGRLGADVGRENAEADLNTITSRIAPASPDTDRRRLIHVLPERVGLLNPNTPSAIAAATAVALAMVGLLVIVACANVASLLLARASARRREIGIRLSLGASRVAIARQLLIEVLILTGMAGGIGLLVSLWSTKIYTAFLPPTTFPFDLSFAPDLGAVLFTVGLSVVAAAVAGLAPALHGARTDLISVLKSDAALGDARAPRTNFLNRVVTTQFACAVVILVIAGLLTRTMIWFQRVELGYAVENRVIATIDTGPLDYTETRGRRLFADLTARFEALPEVTEVSLAASQPLFPFSAEVSVRPSSGPLGGSDALVAVNVVSPTYAPSMEIPILRGRNFQSTDTQGARRVAIVNEMFADRFWPGSDPIGRLISVGESMEPIEVVGVVPDVKTSCLACSPRPDLYLPFTQHYRARMTLHLVTTDPEGLVPLVRPLVAGLDARLVPRGVMTVSDWIDLDRWLARTAASLAATLGTLAIVFASIGLYGVMAFAVTRRTREIGIRVALGAEARDILRLIVGHGTRIALVALGIGLALAIAAARVLRGVLFGVSPNDPTTYVVVAVILIVVAGVASYLPARRAIRLDPTVALRLD